MAGYSPITEPKAQFDITQAITLGAIFLAGILLSLVLYTTPVGSSSMAEHASNLVAPAQRPLLNITLWVFEIGLYFLITWQTTRNNLLIGFSGVLLGILCRVLAGAIIALTVSARMGYPVADVFSQVNGSIWILRVLVIITVALIFTFPCRELLRRYFSSLCQAGRNKNEAQARSFSFNTARGSSPLEMPVRSKSSAGDEQHCAPPEHFMPVVPQEDVFGLVSVPVRVICDSVPEAEAFLQAQRPVRIRLSYIVPQLRNATVWLTWQQIFGTGTDDANRQHGTNRPDAQFQGRWICIPAKEYALQVPAEYYDLKKKSPASWMKLTAVPQESQFDGCLTNVK